MIALDNNNNRVNNPPNNLDYNRDKDNSHNKAFLELRKDHLFSPKKRKMMGMTIRSWEKSKWYRIR
jgi:hypothetical protein